MDCVYSVKDTISTTAVDPTVNFPLVSQDEISFRYLTATARISFLFLLSQILNMMVSLTTYPLIVPSSADAVKEINVELFPEIIVCDSFLAPTHNNPL